MVTRVCLPQMIRSSTHGSHSGKPIMYQAMLGSFIKRDSVDNHISSSECSRGPIIFRGSILTILMAKFRDLNHARNWHVNHKNTANKIT